MIQKDFKSIAFFYLQMILIWIVATLIFLFLRNYGLDQSTIDTAVGQLATGQMILVNVLVGILAGIVYSTIELIFERPYFQRQSYGRILLGKLVFSFFAVKIMMAIGIGVASSLVDTMLERQEMVNILRSKMYWVAFVFFILIAGLISFIRMVSQKFGPGVLWNMFIGKYRNPREEFRVFMFLDLKSSTTIAEQLGHIQFSRLIQNCFADLTPVINKHKVEIYQYVGDEAVLSWPKDSGFEDNHCIHCYFDYMEVLRERSDFYQNEFGVRPVFKAGIHLGKVIVAEVGLIKREIAYHGDVLNTTARIQSRCNALQQQLLVSDDLLQYLKPDEQIKSEHLGEEQLKGKEQLVNIYGIKKR